MTKLLNGSELAGFVKERQAKLALSLRARKIIPKLVIIRNSDDPVINKYVTLKKRYGADIGVEVDDVLISQPAERSETQDKSALIPAIETANADPAVHGIIVQLPLRNPDETDEVVAHIVPKKDVDGLSTSQGDAPHHFDSATATAINWLLAGHDIALEKHKIAVVGKGRLVGRPLIKMWRDSGLDVAVFDRSTSLEDLANFDLIVTATGQPHLIKSAYIQPGSVLVDAGTASESGRLVGDLDEALRSRSDLAAITPATGGVGPLTVSVLFENVLFAASVV